MYNTIYLGDAEGTAEGTAEGFIVGKKVGVVGITVGTFEGAIIWKINIKVKSRNFKGKNHFKPVVGKTVGIVVGACVGDNVGFVDGAGVGGRFPNIIVPEVRNLN